MYISEGTEYKHKYFKSHYNVSFLFCTIQRHTFLICGTHVICCQKWGASISPLFV